MQQFSLGGDISNVRRSLRWGWTKKMHIGNRCFHVNGCYSEWDSGQL